MRGEKTITLDEPIKVSQNGVFVEVNSITLRAPALGKRHVHDMMQTYVMQAVGYLQANRKDMMQQSAAVADNDDDESTQAKREAEDPNGIMKMMSMGLLETYPTFTKYVMKVLTDSPKLATVGEGEYPITDEVWDRLDDLGGIDEVDRVLGTFVGFFTAAPASRKRSGNVTSLSSSSPPTAASRSNTRAASRSRS